MGQMLAHLLWHTLQTTQEQKTQMSHLFAQTVQIQQLTSSSAPRAIAEEIGSATLRGNTEQYSVEFRTENLKKIN
ncbi:Hypothetical protein PHPALM_20873 [Phytophthora palmivora]|uniref:Uncharacterized protein n=1 Tax=Phytophthora palmivora TaxID=4796 RepID=A0A2P4XDQ9_9STRA|nr:Hypothetical protein PHPALM_20873 [Phytophthora palmivora]